jgi:peptidyl-prolyl cis-trans isomerase D
VSDAEAQAYYNAHLDQYKTPEQVKTRHILITVAKGADAKTDAAAKAKAEDVLKQVKAGGNFADLAKKNSDDPGSKDQGGELPMIPTARLDPAYAKAAMALNPGRPPDVVRSQFGYHIIQTERSRRADQEPRRGEGLRSCRSCRARSPAPRQQNFANQLADEAKKNGLQKTAAAHGLHVITTDYLGKDGTIPSLPDSAGTADGGVQRSQGCGSAERLHRRRLCDLPGGGRQGRARSGVREYKSHMLDDYRSQKAPELLNAEADQALRPAKKLGDLHKAAAEMNLPVKTSDLVGRDAQVPEIGALSGAASVVFTLPVGGISGPVNEGVERRRAAGHDKQEPTRDRHREELRRDQAEAAESAAPGGVQRLCRGADEPLREGRRDHLQQEADRAAAGQLA